ncbi:MAG: YjfB family protein [Oscillospiraceae bacterium]|nr:YjfB family protein [Oscillospiraceae bacterium]
MEMSNMIASMAMNMSSASLQQSINTSMMKKTMDTQESMAAQLLQMMDTSPARAFGSDIGAMFDVRA